MLVHQILRDGIISAEGFGFSSASRLLCLFATIFHDILGYIPLANLIRRSVLETM